jgi:predicted ATP-dependent endonuclease of OLD family
MITRISFSNFKGFSKYEVDFSRLNLLVGGNNSGKTTIFHALQLIFWCIERTVDVSDKHATFRKTQVAQIGAVPYFTHRDIFHRQQIQAGRKTIRIELTIETDTTPPLHFSIYRAFSRNLMIDGADQKITRAQYESLMAMRPVYISVRSAARSPTSSRSPFRTWKSSRVSWPPRCRRISVS